MALSQSGMAAGSLLAESNDDSAIVGHRALVVWRADEVELHLELALKNPSPELFWMFAVPTTPTIAMGNADVFDELQTLSSPTVELRHSLGASGCSSSDGSAGPSVYRPDPPDIFRSDTPTVAATTEVITATTIDKLVEQLEQRGIPVPQDASARFEPYINQRMVFVVARLETVEGAATSRMQPLVLSFARPASSSITYALGLSARPNAQSHPAHIYQLSDRRYRIANYGSLSFDRFAEAVRDTWRQTGDADYDGTLEDLSIAAGGRLAVTEFAAQLTDRALPDVLANLRDVEANYLTRFYLRPRGDDLVDLELRFGADGPDEDGIARISEDDSDARWFQIPLWLLVLAGLGLRIHRYPLKGAGKR